MTPCGECVLFRSLHKPTRSQVAFITTSKADADRLIAALKAPPPPPPADDGRKRRRRRRKKRRAQVEEYVPRNGGAVEGEGEGGEVAPGVVESFEAIAARTGEEDGSARQGEVTEGVVAHMAEEKVRCAFGVLFGSCACDGLGRDSGLMSSW